MGNPKLDTTTGTLATAVGRVDRPSIDLLYEHTAVVKLLLRSILLQGSINTRDSNRLQQYFSSTTAVVQYHKAIGPSIRSISHVFIEHAGAVLEQRTVRTGIVWY